MFFCRFQPVLKLGGGTFPGSKFVAGPVPIFVFRRGIDDPGDMARTGKHEADRAREHFGAGKDGLRRSDMVLPGCQLIDRQANLFDFQPLAAKLHLPPGQLVLLINFAQLKAGIGCRSAR